MESGNGGASSKGVLVPVSASSDAFQISVVAPLKSAYLYEESKQSFRYKSAVLVKNPALEEKYNAFRAKRRETGYSEEDLKESYGFLLFDDVNKANALGETGVLTGNSTCTTLGDPSKGVYISMYSDCLDLNRWYHGKSGYIAIIRLTKGRVKKVLENYTQNFTAPTESFDCHVSDQLPSVSAKTSSFLAFERTQYYMYELLDDGSNETAQSPSAACPFAIVSFSYTDTKDTLVAPEEKSEEKKQVFHYFPWRGQLQIGTNLYDVGLRSTEGALVPVKLPPVVKVDRVISMLDLRQLLPRAVFETCFTGEVFLDGLYCSLCELVSSETEETSSLSLLLWEIKEKDVALTVPLNDGGFLVLLHSSHFLTYDDTGSSASEVLQGMFVFPDSRVIQKDTKFGQRKPAIQSEILRVLPVLSYAEGEVEKTSADPNEDLCEVFSQHMQRYAALINPGMAQSPAREVSIFPDHYDVPDDHKHLYSSPEWTNRAWQNVRSYLSKPASFQLPVSKASEILMAGQDERIDDLHDDVYFCLSSPEEASVNHDSMGSEDQLTDKKSVLSAEASMDSCTTSAETQVEATAVPQNVVPDGLQPGDASKDTEKSDLTALIKTYDVGTKSLLTPSTSEDLPAELIVSISSAERTVTDASLSVISTGSATKHNDFQLSGFSTAKLHMAGVNSLNDETVKTEKGFDSPELTSLTKTKSRKLRRGLSRGRKSKACTEQSVTLPVEDDNLKSQKEDQAMESSGHPQLSNPSNTDWRKVRRRKRIFGKLSPRTKRLRFATVGLAVAEKENAQGADPGQQSFDRTILVELEACPLRRKTERWDLKPVISECGRILVPHGSVDVADQIKSLKDKLQSTKDEQSPEKLLVDASVDAHDTVTMEQESSKASETAVDEKEATPKVGGNHLQNVSQINTEPSVLKQPDDGNGSLTLNPVINNPSSKTDGTNSPPLKAVQEKPDTPSSGKCSTKGELILSKLKSVLLGGKRKTGILVSMEATADAAQDTEPHLKKGKVDSHSGSNDAITSVQNTSLSVKEVPKISVDPDFAYALGLTPKETPDKIQKSEDQDPQQRKDSSDTQEQTKIIQRPLSIFPRRTRIKTLKKHQGIPTEHVRKKWWLHFQTPACFASENLKYNDCTRDNSVRKTVKEKSSSACSSTDALNLLADLALGASKDQVPPQPDPALEREPETSLKKCDLTKDLTTAEQESVLHALLRQPAARPIQPVESPAPSHLVGGSELVDLVSKEHAYSLPPSSSLLLGLSGTPFQVSPISGSTRLLHHHQTMYGDGIKTLHSSVDLEDRSEHGTPEYLKKQMVRRRKFRQSRTFVCKDGSIQVTKQWKENYDFNLDSKFTSDLKDRVIIRALHGPWDFSTQDTNEELRLIVHMWIGLFYSRTTARFFHVDSNCSSLCSEEGDSLDLSSGMESAVAQSEPKTFDTSPIVTDTSDSSTSEALDLSKKDTPVLDQGTVILDLSLKNSNAEIITSDPQVSEKETSVPGEQKEASETLKTVTSSMGLHKGGPFQSYRKSVHLITSMNDVRRTYDNKRNSMPVQKAGCMKHIDVPSFKDGGTFISVKEGKESASVQPAISKKTFMKDNIENSEPAKTSLVQKHGRDSSKSVLDKEGDSTKRTGDVAQKAKRDISECKDGEKKEKKEKIKLYQEGNATVGPKLDHTGDSTSKASDTVCNGNLLENKLPQEEPKAVPPEKVGHVNEDKVIKADHFEKEDGLDEKDHCISDMEAGGDLNDQPLPMMCDGPDTVKEDCITECNRQAPLDEQPPQADKKEDASNDLQSTNLCANGNSLTDKHAISDTAPCPPSDMAAFRNEPADVGDSENKVHLADSSDQPSPMICDGSDSVEKNAITECNHQEPLDEVPPQGDNKEDADHDFQSRELCAKGSAFTDEHAIAEKAPRPPSEVGPVHNESAFVENSENHVCVTDLGDQPSPEMSDGPDSVKRDGVTECNHQRPLNEESPQAGNKEDANHDLQSRELCANVSALTDEQAISEKALHTQAEVKPTHNELMIEENSENGVCLVDLSDQPLPMICDGPELVKTECITECNHQAPLDEQPSQADQADANASALTDEHAISEKAPHTPEITQIHNEPAVEENSENDACLADKALPMTDENTRKLDGSSVDLSIPQINYSESGSQNKVKANFTLSSDDHEYQDTKSVEGKKSVDNTTKKELFYHQSYDFKCEDVTRCAAEVASTQEAGKSDINEGLEKIHGRVVIPFIGVDISGEDAVQPHDSHSEGKVEEVQGQKGIPFISETTFPETALPTEVCSTSQMNCKKTELSVGKTSLLHVSETNLLEVSGSESDDRCPTPTMDEEPYEYITCLGPNSSSRSSISALSGSEASKNMTQKCLSRNSTFIKKEMPLERKHKSAVNSDPSPQRGHHPDLELRTLRVLQSIDKFLSKSSHTDKSSQIKTGHMKHSLDQTPNTSITYTPTCIMPHTSADFKDKKISNTKPMMVSPSTLREPHAESSDHFRIAPFKSKLEQVLGVRLQLKKPDSPVNQHYSEKTEKPQENSVGQDYRHFYRSFPSAECSQASKANIDQDGCKTPSQTSLSHEPRSYSQRPVMAVKPSKSDEILADCSSTDRQMETSVMPNYSQNKQTEIPLFTYATLASIILEKKAESLRERSAALNDHKQEASELSAKSSCFSKVSDSKSNSDKAKFALLDPLYQYEGRDTSKFSKIPSSSLPMQAFEYAKTSSELDGNQSSLTNTWVEKAGQPAKENIEMDRRDCSDASTSVADYKENSLTNDSLFLGPHSTLTCTVYNTSQKKPETFLEQVSRRCLQDDPTQASMEQECLIFTEQMKQLLKRSRWGPNHQLDTHDKLNLCASSPVTVHFSNLEDEDSVDHFDTPSLVGQKIKVDMSDRKDLTDITEEGKTWHTQKPSQGASNPMEHAGVSCVTAECARLYRAMMDDICGVGKVPSRSDPFRMDRGSVKTEPSNHFDFCDQMKREMDESFRSNLNSVVKKSCKTKYRFYILVTSDEPFFEETKAQLEAEGHTAVQPSEFFLSEDSSSSLLIILRNEDIAEHICEVPRLLELKKSPGVQFAGIDEPDDVVNLTHQELFMRGGFIMFDKAALESLTVCNMKKMSEILQELSRMGKWKWMLHYRDSRRLKENARLSPEAKEKKHYLNWCQEVGIVEVLPYHECDLTSRDEPDYLTCLVRLQVQNISARYPVFITDTTTDSAFGTNGILTMTSSAILTCSPSETFTA